ncbi:MAG: caspase family protein [Pseudobacter sp.]|uniref:caspase family protein n=1 Tax=Pseudobacter sp. TaxID=2045420 RepID=UPI003F7E2159
MKKVLYFILSIQTAFAQVQRQASEKIAVVIGVSNYEAVTPLKNCLNDANDLTQKLTKLGFNVVLLLDPDVKTVRQKLDSLKKKLQPSDTFLFFFSGHGIEYNGENYFFMKNSAPTSDKNIPEETVALNDVLGVIKFARTKTGIIILDACRSNPFVEKWRSFQSNKGLKDVDTPAGVFIGYAAAPGKAASGGIRNNSLYTEALLKFIEIRGISIDQLFTKINKEVRITSDGKQIPHKSSSLEEEFFFNVNP